MTDITHITDYFERAQDRLISQFKEKPNINLLLSVMVQPLQEFENVLIEVLRDRWIDTAQGVQLDGLGKILGVERQGMTDDQYRDALRLQIGINTSTGIASVIIDIVGIITQSTLVEMSEYFPACIDIYVNGDNINDYIVITIKRIIAAGVCLILRVGKDAFGFFGDPTAKGFNDVGYDAGGGMVDLIETGEQNH